MFPETIFDAVLDDLTDELRGRATPAPIPLATDSWVARSVLQKAIRRGMLELALSAAAQLVIIDRRTLWRRLIVTALEDLGPQEFETTTAIVSAARNSGWRSQVGGDWPVAAELVRLACAGTRNQVANDLWNIALHDTNLAEFKSGLCEANKEEVLRSAADTGLDVGARAAAVLVALRQVSGSDLPDHLTIPSGDVFAAFEDEGNLGVPVAVCAEAYRLTRVPLAALMLCASAAGRPVQSVASSDDVILPPVWVGGVPTFALDQYTRSGKAAITQFVSQSADWKAFASFAGIDRGQWVAAAGELLFRVDGAAVSKRTTAPWSTTLRNRSLPLGCFMLPLHAPAGLALMRAQMPLIDQIRVGLQPFP